MNKRKIFCIGFNKTGTVSLHQFLLLCGLDCLHHHKWPFYTRIAKGEKFFKHQCYLDGEKSDFINLDKWFPNSLFILNYRSERNWVIARIKHVMRNNEIIDINHLMKNTKLKGMAKDFFIDEASTIRKWICERRIYHKQAKSYFNGSKRFIEIDVTSNFNWATDLRDFFDKNSIDFNSNTSVKNIHANKRPSNHIKNQTIFQKYMELLDCIIQELQ